MIGTAREVRGFTLAGVAVEACDCAAGLERALNASRSPGPPAGLVLVSSGLAETARGAIREFLRRDPPPALLVVPREIDDEAFPSEIS